MTYAGVGAFLEYFWGVQDLHFADKIYIIPMIEEHMFIREDFMNIFKANINNLTN